MTPQHHIIKETSDTISRLLTDEFKRSGYKRVHIIEEAPKQDAVEGKLPAVSCYLYQVSPDAEGIDGNASRELVRVREADGTIKEFSRDQRMWMRLDYLVSCWAQTPEDEQLLLGLVVRTMLDNRVVKGEQLRGESLQFEDKFELPLTISSRLDEGTLARFWGSLQQPVRPAIQIWTTVPILPEAMEPLTRVRRKAITYRDLNQPYASGETGPENNPLLTRRDLSLGSGGKR